MTVMKQMKHEDEKPVYLERRINGALERGIEVISRRPGSHNQKDSGEADGDPAPPKSGKREEVQR